MYNILKPSGFWKIWRKRPPNFISGWGAPMALIQPCFYHPSKFFSKLSKL